MATWDIDSDAELKTRVRAETQYDDTADELPAANLDTLIADAKIIVANKTGSTSWYADRGLTAVLLGVTCIKAKAAVENETVTSWDFGSGTINIRDSDGESLQVADYRQMISEGMTASNVSTRQTPAFGNTHDYIG